MGLNIRRCILTIHNSIHFSFLFVPLQCRCSSVPWVAWQVGRSRVLGAFALARTAHTSIGSATARLRGKPSHKHPNRFRTLIKPTRTTREEGRRRYRQGDEYSGPFPSSSCLLLLLSSLCSCGCSPVGGGGTGWVATSPFFHGESSGLTHSGFDPPQPLLQPDPTATRQPNRFTTKPPSTATLPRRTEHERERERPYHIAPLVVASSLA